ncbi:hypothetical protein D3C87_1177580 [compost metagenome]
MQNGDLVVGQCARQGFRVARHLLGSQPQRGAYQVGDPDFLERHVEGDGKALVDGVGLRHFQHGVFAAQEVADAALIDQYALGLARGTGCVDHVGRVFGQYGAARGQLFARCGGGQQAFRRPHGTFDAGVKQARRELRAADDTKAIRIIEAHLQALDGRIFIDGQPGGARLGDGCLHQQQMGAARQPQAHDVAGLDAGRHQASCGQAGLRIELRIRDAAFAIDQGNLLGTAAGRRFQQVGQYFLAQQIRSRRAVQDVGVGGRDAWTDCGEIVHG